MTVLLTTMVHTLLEDLDGNFTMRNACIMSAKVADATLVY